MKKNQYLYRKSRAEQSNGGFFIDRLGTVATVLGWIFVILLGLQWTNIWPFTLFGYFSIYCIPLLAIFAILTSGGLNKTVFSIAFVLLGVLAIMPPQAWQTKPKDEQKSVLRLWFYDVGLDNVDKSTTATALLDADTDMLALTGSGGDEWQANLQTVSAVFKYGCGTQKNTPYSMRLMSKVPIQDCELTWVKEDQYPYIRATTNKGAVVYVLHAPTTTDRNMNDDNKEYLNKVARAITSESAQTLVVGNLNIVPLTPAFQNFTKSAQVVTQMLNGVPTWKSNGLYLHLDHVLSRVRDDDSVITTVLPWGTSTHRPISVDWESES